MISRFARFNLYLCVCLSALALGCKTTEEKQRAKEAATIRFHLETNPDGTPWNSGISVYRANPVIVNVVRDPFLTEGDVQQASVVDAIGGFLIKLQFNRHGTFVLDSVTASSKGRRIAIQSHFGETRWLAAPLVRGRVSDGSFIFTPDATREEAERIVRGINNVVAKLASRSHFKR